MFDIAKVRADTPGCHSLVHLNNAGSALPPRQVVDAQIDYLRAEMMGGGYEVRDAHADTIDASYRDVAALIGARPQSIAMMSNATEAWQLALASIPLAAGDRILTAQAEYGSNFIHYLKLQQQLGIQVEVIPNDERGQTDPAALADLIDGRVRLIAISHMPTNGGLINPARAIGEVAKAAQVPYVLDACQTVGQLHIDVEDIGCDVLTATGRKYLRGPRGTGFLYASDRFLEVTVPPFLDIHGATWSGLDRFEMRADARRYENFEFSFANIIGLGVAAAYATAIGTDVIEERVIGLAADLRTRLAALPGITVWDVGARQGGIVSFSHPMRSAAEIVEELKRRRINTSLTTPFSTLVDAEARSLPNMVRASAHYYNTEDEVDRLSEAVREIVA